MQAGDTFEYEGAAVIAETGDNAEIAGRFIALEERTHEGERRWLVEDVRRGEFEGELHEDAHRYLVPAGFEPAPPAA